MTSKEIELYSENISKQLIEMQKNVNHKLDVSILNDVKRLVDCGILEMELVEQGIKQGTGDKLEFRSSIVYNLKFKAEERIKELEEDIKALQHVQSDWISVEDRLPKQYDEDYLVCVKNKNKEGGIFIVDCKNFNSDSVWVGGNTYEIVTHWQPLPQPPKQ